MALDPKAEIYDGDTAKTIVKFAAICSVGALFWTLWVVYRSFGGGQDPLLLYVTIGVWAVGPPIWFWYEYYYLYRVHGAEETLDLFKYGQDVSKAIWAGVLAALIALAASDIVKAKKADDCRCCCSQASTVDTTKKSGQP